MGSYHINGAGEVGLCRATTGACPFGKDSDHHPTAKAARSAYEQEQQAPTGRALMKASALAKLPLGVTQKAPDYFAFTLSAEDGRKLTTFTVRLLPGKRVWPQWRENHYGPANTPPPRGVHGELQRRVSELLPEWELTSSPYELSPEGEAFRKKYMELNPTLAWTLDRKLDSDEGTEEATPRMEAAAAEQAIAGTPLAKLLKA
jgi:hypothetical protein